MSFIKVEAVRAIKLHNRTYRSAHQAAVAYSLAAKNQFHWLYQDRVKHLSGPAFGVWLDNVEQKFYRRSHKIFTKYFNGA